MTRATIVLLLVVALSFAARSFLPEGVTITGSGGALAFGFVLLVALQTGHIFHGLRLPHLTGFLLCGMIFGPEVLGLLTKPMVADLAMVKNVSVGLIALNAGCELNFKVLRPRLTSIATYATGGLLTAFVLLFTLFFLVTPLLDFAKDMSVNERMVVALVGANVLIALSPSVAMGVISETHAAGPVAETCLSIVVIADLVVAVSFALSGAVAKSVFASGANESVVGTLLWHVLGSMAVGIGAGVVLGIYVARVGKRVGLFVFGVWFVLAEVGTALHLDPLLIGLAAGLFLENVSPIGGHRVIHETEAAATPTFAIFFATIGAEIHLHAFFSVAIYGVAAAATRALGITFGTRVAGRVVGLDPTMTRRVKFGMFPQAGIAIALSNLVKATYPGWGEGLGTLLLGTVVVNEMLGPIFWRATLVAAGEVGKKVVADAASHTRKEDTVPLDLTHVQAAVAADGDAP